MKTQLIFIVLVSIHLYANENWIKIEPIQTTQTKKTPSRLDVNLSQIEPINKMVKNATVIKQILDATNKIEKQNTPQKNWFLLNNDN